MDESEYNDFTINPLDENAKKKDLLKQEIEVNLQEQVLVNKRIILIKETFETLPNSDPEYAIFQTQLQMDQIQLDELKSRERDLRSSLDLFL